MKTQWIIGIGLSIIAVSPLARADEASDKAAIRRNYRAADAALKRGDLSKIGATLTDDYRQYLLDGRVANKAQTMQITQIGIKTLRMKFAPSVIQSLQVKGDRAIVVGASSGTFVQRDARGKAHTVTMRGTARDYQRKVGGVWKSYRGDELSREVRMDGKVISKIDVKQTKAPPKVLRPSQKFEGIEVY